MRKIARSLLNGFLVLVLLLELGFGAAYLYVNSAGGLKMLASRGSVLASSEGQIITIGPLNGRVFSNLNISSITLADKQGVWLEIRGLHVQWRPRQLLRSQAPLEKVTVDEIIFDRLPKEDVSTAKPASKGSGSPSLNDIATYLPRDVAIGSIWVKPDVAGVEQKLTLTGGGNADRYALHLKTLEGVETALDAVVVPHAQDFNLQLVFHEAASGVVGALIGLPNDTALALEADGAADMAGAIHLTKAQITAGALSVQASGDYQPKTKGVQANLLVNASDLAVLQAMAGVPMSGSATVSLTAQGALDALHATLSLDSPHVMVDQTSLDALHFGADGNVNAAGWGTDRFSADGSINGQAVYEEKPVQFAAHLLDAGGMLTVSNFAGHYGANELKAELTAKGSFEKFDLKATSTLSAPDANSTLTLDGSVDTITPHYAGTAEGTFRYLKEAFDFAADVDATDKRASVKKLSLTGPGTDLSAVLDMQIPEQLADGKIRLKATDLAPLGRMLQQPLSGAVDANIMLTSSGEKQQLDGKLIADKLQAFSVRAAHVEVNAKTDDVKALGQMNASLAAQSVSSGNAKIEKLTASAKGSLKKGLAVLLDGAGLLDGKPWVMKLAGQADQPNDDQANFQLRVLDGSFAKAPIRLQSPATVRYTPTRSELTPFTLLLADGSVQAKGNITPNQVSGVVTINHVALEKVPTLSLPKGKLDATVNLSGTAAAPVLSWKATSTLAMDAIPLHVKADGDWKNANLRSTVTATSDQANANATIAIRAPLTLSPFNMGITDQTKLAGNVKAHLPLAMFNTQLRPSGNRVTGEVSGQAALAGTVGAPSFNGKFNLTNGTYDQADSGVCLRGMQATITGSQQAISIEKFQATDTNKHLFNASGKLALAGNQSFSGQANFDHFRLFCGGLASGDVDGKLNASGTPKAMTIAGKMVLGPLNVQIPGNRGSSNIPSVPVQWVVPGQVQRSSAEGPSSVAFDIGLEVPGQLYVRGRGLDAEFFGKLRIKGTAEKPNIVGQLEKRRGKFTLLDRVLTLETAILRFEGAIPPSPYMEVSANTLVNGTTITVGLTGTAKNPSLVLSSSPALPQDELLAQLLFGRDLDKISPFEAIKLGQAARTLGGMDSGGPDILGSLRDTLGLDTLDVGSGSDSGSVNVSTGKYLTDKVYVGVSQGTTPEDRKVTTEINLTPSISGKTSVDMGGDQSVGFNWKRDY